MLGNVYFVTVSNARCSLNSQVSKSSNVLRGYLVGEVSARVRRDGLKFADARNLHINAGSKRFSDFIEKRGKGRVNFPASLKVFMKQCFPDLQFKQKLDDHHFFSTTKDGYALTVDFTKIHGFGLGKVFELNFEIDLHAADLEPLRISLAECFDSLNLQWVYGDLESLEECFAEVAKLLEVLIPAIKHTASWFMQSSADELIKSLRERRNLSFREATQLALNVLATACPEAKLLVTATMEGTIAYVNEANRLDIVNHAPSQRQWSIELAEPGSVASMKVIIPELGPIRFLKGIQIGHVGSNHIAKGQIAMPPAIAEEMAEHLAYMSKHLGDEEVFCPIIDNPFSFGLVSSENYRLQMRLDANEQKPANTKPVWNVFLWMIDGFDHSQKARVNHFQFSAHDGSLL